MNHITKEASRSFVSAVTSRFLYAHGFFLGSVYSPLIVTPSVPLSLLVSSLVHSLQSLRGNRA